MSLQDGCSTQRRKGKGTQRSPRYYFETFAFLFVAFARTAVWVYKKVVQRKDAKEKPAKDAQVGFEPFALIDSLGLTHKVYREQ
jgi:hypothetical protein